MKAKIIRRMDIAQLNISYIFMQCLHMVEYTWVPSHLQTHTLYKKSTLPGTNYVFMVLFCCCCCCCCFSSWGTNHVISCQFHMNYIIWLLVLCCYRIILKEITSNIETRIYSWPFAILIIYKWPVNSVEWLLFCTVCWWYKYVCHRKKYFRNVCKIE